MTDARDAGGRVELELAGNDVVEIETDARLMVRAEDLAQRLSGSLVMSRSGTAADTLAILRESVLQAPPGLCLPDAAGRSPLGYPPVRGPKAKARDLVREYEDRVPLGLEAVEPGWQPADAGGGVAARRGPGGSAGPVVSARSWILDAGQFRQAATRSARGLAGAAPCLPGPRLVQNALDLLPEGTELHLVSHSRGGLVGELPALGHRVQPSGGTVLRPADLALFPDDARLRTEGRPGAKAPATG